MIGWIKLHRQLCEHKLWTCEPFTRGQAWVDLLLLANHEDGFFYLRDHKIEVKRGQVGWSILKLSLRWGWSRSKTTKFVNDLEKEQQVIQQQSKSTSILTIINYEQYQEKEQQSIQQKDNRKTTERQQKDTNKNDKNEENEKNDKKLEEVITINPIPKVSKSSVKPTEINNHLNLSLDEYLYCRLWFEFLYSGWVKRSNKLSSWIVFSDLYKKTESSKREYLFCLIDYTNYHYREMYKGLKNEGYKRPNFDKHLKEAKYLDHEDSFNEREKESSLKMFNEFKEKNGEKYV